MAKRDHLKDYVPTKDGGYEYTGARWAWPSPEVRDEFLRGSLRLFAIGVVCVVIAGCVPAPGTFGTFYVVIPYLICVIGVALSGVALFRLSREDNPMRDHVYSASVPALPVKLLVGALGCIVCAVAALAHGIGLMVVGQGEFIALTLLFSALMAAGAACLLAVRARAEALVFTRS